MGEKESKRKKLQKFEQWGKGYRHKEEEEQVDDDTRGQDWWMKPRAGASSAEEGVAVAIAVVAVEVVGAAVGLCEIRRLAGASAAAVGASAAADRHTSL